MRTIYVPPGIGDSIWLFMKLLNAGEKFQFKMTNHYPQRGKQIFDLLPQLSGDCRYVEGVPPFEEWRQYAKKGKWQNIKAREFYLECNTHLELGKRIEKYLPDLDTTFKIDYKTAIADYKKAVFLLPGLDDQKYIGIYGSAYSTARKWGFWDEFGWWQLIKRVYRKTGATMVIIGAEWDLDLGRKLMQKLSAKGVPFINTIGEPLGTVIEVMKRLDYFFGFPSGLSILNETLQKDGMMFYPPHLRHMIGSWSQPNRHGKNFKEALFCTPEKAFEWWNDNVTI